MSGKLYILVVSQKHSPFQFKSDMLKHTPKMPQCPKQTWKKFKTHELPELFGEILNFRKGFKEVSNL